ncbi:MAG TPA: DUF6580 family putative transport protein [Terriglobales bacterium]|jgi:hypothetical protein|nr:DUF6580 family putative transport protein [Terriglobales bacterium]
MLAYLFVVLAVAVRFLPHPWSFTPVVGALLFFGARGPRRQLWFPFALLAVSDVVLTKFVYAYPFTWDHYVTWAWYAAIVWVGTNLRENAKPVRVLGAALASSTSFFLLSNFAVWAGGTMYPHNWAGLMTSYTLGLPFFRPAIEGDLLFTAAMFATPGLLYLLAGALGKHGDHAASA